MPSGEVRILQGFEPLAMDRLLKIFSEDDIVTGNREIELCIGARKRYFPDIYVRSRRLVIEVKSR